MTNREHLPRRYGDVEISRILKRAADLQMMEGAAAPGTGGHTLRELEEIAREVGIDAHYLQRAATELDAATTGSKWTWFTGRPATLVRERTVDGEIPAVALEAVLAQIQRSAGVVGQPNLLGRTLTWRSDAPSATRSLEVVVTPREGATQIHIQERLHGLAGALFGSLMGGVGGGVGFGVGVGVGMGALGSALFAVSVPLGAIASSYIAARVIFSSAVTRRQAALDDLLGHLVDLVTDAIPARADVGIAPPDDTSSTEPAPSLPAR
jgi:hypothetical protein